MNQIKPYTLIIVPQWLFDRLRPAIEKTAKWRLYLHGGSRFRVACVQTLEVANMDGAYNDTLFSYTCGSRDNAIEWYACDDYEAALRHIYQMAPDFVPVSPE